MKNNWKTYTLGQIATFQRGFDITKKEQKPGSFPVVSSSGIKSYHNKFKVSGPGVVIGRKGTLGSVHFLEGDYWPHDTTLWVKDFHSNQPKFIFYLMKNFDVMKFDTGSSNPTLNRNHIHEVEFLLPPLPEQQAIAEVLGALDDKIELNRKTNQTLEQMAMALYKHYFVDFGPFQNGDFIDSELGPIPEGWEVKRMNQICSKIGSGATPRGGKSAYIEKGVHIIRSQNIHDFFFKWAGIACITDTAAEKLKGVTVQENDVLINITGDSILRTSFVHDSVLPARVNQHVAILRSIPPIPKSYIHLHLLSLKEWMIGHFTGGTRKAITKSTLENIPVFDFHSKIWRDFGEQTLPLYKMINHNWTESQTLAQTRDYLLPKLISGQVRVKDIEKQIGGML